MNKKIKQTFLGVLLVFGAILVTGCLPGNNNDAPVEPVALIDGFERHETDYYEIQFPSDWTRNGSRFIAPDESVEINIVREELPMAMSAEEYKEASLEALQNAFGASMRSTTTGEKTVNGMEAFTISYDLAMRGVPRPIATFQTLLTHNTTGFVITIAGITDETREIYEQMLSTFAPK